MRTKKSVKLLKTTLILSFALIMGLMTKGPCWAEVCGTPLVTRLIAGQNLDAGTVTVTNDENSVYVTYLTDGTWTIAETHLDVATSPEQLKQTSKGNAIPGKFAYATEHNPGVYEVTHTIDIAAWAAGTPLYFAAHAVVSSPGSTETAWGEGLEFPGKNWAMYFGYDLQICGEPPLNPGIIEFQDPNISEWENVTSIVVTLNRSEGSDGIVSVDVISTDITTTTDEDYVGMSTTVVFEDGETVKQVEVFILNDQIDEDNEQLQLYLTNVVGAELGPQDTATITIIDDDEPSLGTLFFAQPEYIVNEGDEFVNIQVERTQATDGIVSVDYSLSPVSAEAGSDYADVSGTLLFETGEVSKVITVQIIDDYIIEASPEIFTVDLSNPTGATIQEPAGINVLIIDDDDVPH